MIAPAVPVVVALVLIVIVLPATAVTVVPAAMPVPAIVSPTEIGPTATTLVSTLLPRVRLAAVA